MSLRERQRTRKAPRDDLKAVAGSRQVRELLAAESSPGAPAVGQGGKAAPSAVVISWPRQLPIHRLINRHETAFRRLLDLLPGLTTWSFILVPLLLAERAPIIPILIVILCQAYWLYRGITMVAYGAVARGRVRAAADVDWREQYQAARAAEEQVLPWAEIRHLVVIPNYREPVGKLRATLEALANQRDVASQIWVVLAMEGSEEGALEKARLLQREFRGRLGAVFYAIHPPGLPGEIPGKASNQAWAARWAREHCIGRGGYDIRRVTITSCDADSLFHPSYFACLTCKFALDPDRYRRFWQAPVLYHNNIWRVPTFIRFVTMWTEIWQLASLANPRDDLCPVSTYSASLALIDGVGYWDPDVIAEDWQIFTKCFFQRRGRVTLEPIYLPVTADAPLSTNPWRTAVNRYEQGKRHAWGVQVLAYAFRMAFQHGEIRARAKLPRVWMLIREHVLTLASWFAVAVGVSMPLLLNPAFAASRSGLLMQMLYALLAGLASALSLATLLLDRLLYPPGPRERKWWQSVWAYLQWPLLPVYMLLFFALPALEAHTRMMFGQQLAYRVTEKA